ncbi:MAG: DUF4476 domain-containing protein [Chitinophagales bacterium]|nr:DUF4476 domain-containing protein [Chitinophagales bacterium]
MNKLLLSLLFFGIAVSVASQKVYFVYLQSEQEQPFFVKLNEKVHSSSASGYLILSKLKDSSYTINIGFPQNKWPEQRFAIDIKAKDQGFLLKNFGDKGWGLFDMQSLAVQMSQTTVNKEISNTVQKPVSAFTDILAKAADDSTLRERPVVANAEEKKPEIKIPETAKKEEIKPAIITPDVIKPEESKPVVKTEELTKKEELKPVVADTVLTTVKDTKAQITNESVATKPPVIEEKPVVKTDEQKMEPIKEKQAEALTDNPPVTEEVYKKSVVIRKGESSTTEGFGLTYIDEFANGSRDTIRILIPNPKPVAGQVKPEPKQEKKFLEITNDIATVNKEVIQSANEEVKQEAAIKQNNQAEVVVEKTPAASACKEVAIEADFLKLRKNMAAAETDDDMIDEAKKYFKSKCFATSQIKNLSTLFLNEAGKYKFFDLAYQYASDPANFRSLVSELKDEYYINRFKAMLRN